MSRTKWGQNFLVDPNWQKKIAQIFVKNGLKDSSDVKAEIGPGRGAITQFLIPDIPNLEVFEIDARLRDLHADRARVHGDFLEWNFDERQYAFVGNLPYESGTEMVMKIARHSSQVPYFLFMLQQEVVERICAVPKTKAFGVLSVLIQSQFEVSSVGRIPPSVFNPPPKVWSGLVEGRRRLKGTQAYSLAFEEFIKLCFRHKRKMLRNNLLEKFESERIDFAFSKLHLNLKARAEELEVSQFFALKNELAT